MLRASKTQSPPRITQLLQSSHFTLYFVIVLMMIVVEGDDTQALRNTISSLCSLNSVDWFASCCASYDNGASITLEDSTTWNCFIASLASTPDSVLTGLDFYSRELSALGKDVFSSLTNLQTLDFYSNSLVSIESGTFNGLNNLRYLGFYYNSLTSIEPGNFNGLNNLLSLELDYNSLTSLPSDVFSGLSELVYLSLYGNSLTSIESGTFNNLNSLRLLDLRYNSITTLVGLDFNYALESLLLKYNKIRVIPHSFTFSTSIEKIDFTHNSISTIITDTPSSFDKSRVRLSYNCLDCNIFKGQVELDCDSETQEECPAYYSCPDELVLQGCFDCTTGSNPKCLTCDYKHKLSYCGCSECTDEYCPENNTVYGDSPCDECVDISGVNTCQTCFPGYHLSGTSNPSCVSCDSNSCCLGGASTEPAAVNCSTCSSDGNCTKCVDGFFLLNGQCYDRSDPNLQVFFLKIFYRDLCNSHSEYQTEFSNCCRNEDIDNLTLSNIPECYGKVSVDDDGFIIKLDLSNLGLLTFPPANIENFIRLISLSLRSNNLQSPESVLLKGPESLIYLDLSDNKFISFMTSGFDSHHSPQSENELILRKEDDETHSAFSDLNNLQSLDVSKNSLNKLNDGLFNYSNSLKNLNLSSNNINSIDSGSFNSLSSLQDLDLGLNQLPSIQDGLFNSLGSLQNLSLEFNSISSISGDTFQGLNNLTSLNIGSNSLTSLPSDAFQQLNSLTSLRINDNSLTSIPPDIFQNLPSLTEVDLSNNELTSIPPDLFDDQKSLKELTLNNNNLTSIPDNILNKVDDLENMNLSGNCIDCSDPKYASNKACENSNQNQCSTSGGCSRSMLWSGCIRCPDNEDYTFCNGCSEGYVLKKGKCKACLDTQCCPENGTAITSSNCARCSANRDSCQLCVSEYTLKEGKCQAKTSSGCSLLLSFFTFIVLVISSVLSL